MEEQREKLALSGNEAIARGFYEAGGMIASSYPGSPTVEVLESIKQHKDIYAEFSTNEKVALEMAIGGSFFGVRSMVVMKHVGVNIAADPLMTFTQTPTNGGFLLVTGDDPGLASSQNEQDNRVLGKFANMGILDPSDGQEAKDFTIKALEISEMFSAPMMLRITSRLCHSKSAVETGERTMVERKAYIQDINKYCMIPPSSRQAQYFMRERLTKLEEFAYDTDLNTLERKQDSDTLVITSGLVYNNLRELDLNVSIWKLGMVYPISQRKAKEVVKGFKRVIILEETTPFIENELKQMGIKCEGKKYFSFTGELHIEDIAQGLAQAGVINESRPFGEKVVEEVSRLPLFCAGCPHRPIIDILKKVKKKILIGDIGCYSMAFLPPFEQSDAILSMGTSLGIIKGIRKAMTACNEEEPIVSVIGDGTLFHTGIPGFINLLHQSDEKENITVIVLDNRTTAMTGGQQNASSGRFNKDDDMRIDIKSLLHTIGFNRVREVNQFDYKAAQQAIKEEMDYHGVSIIIANGPCALKYKIRKPHYYVDPKKCIGCRACIKTNCPPLRMKEYKGIDKLKSFIDKEMCVGCAICAQVCPVNAIKQFNTVREEG